MKDYPARRRYQNRSYAAHYDGARYGGIQGRIKNWNTLSTINRALKYVNNGSLILDVPCGTGRLAPLILHNGFSWIGADISFEMMEVARKKVDVFKNVAGNVRLEAEYMPFKSASIDCVASIRFIYHVPTRGGRIAILREMRRISKKWVVIDYNYPNPVRALYRRIGHLVRTPKRKRRLTMEEIHIELADAGLKVYKAFPVSRVLSDNVIFLCTGHDILLKN